MSNKIVLSGFIHSEISTQNLKYIVIFNRIKKQFYIFAIWLGGLGRNYYLILSGTKGSPQTPFFLEKYFNSLLLPKLLKNCIYKLKLGNKLTFT